MNKAAPPTPWYAPWRASAAEQDDPADLGTAFGLDMSMPDPEHIDAERALAKDSGQGWIQRLTGWRVSST